MCTKSYLGSCFQSDGDDSADVNHRMNVAQSCFSDLYQLWRDNRLPTSMKIRLYRSAVCSSFTHACEAWDLNESILKTINGFNSRCLSVITKGDVHELARDPPFHLVLTIRKRRLRYLGHILRMEQDRLVKRTLIALTKRRHSISRRLPLHGCRKQKLHTTGTLGQTKRTLVETGWWPHPLIINNCAAPCRCPT